MVNCVYYTEHSVGKEKRADKFNSLLVVNPQFPWCGVKTQDTESRC